MNPLKKNLEEFGSKFMKTFLKHANPNEFFGRFLEELFNGYSKKTEYFWKNVFKEPMDDFLDEFLEQSLQSLPGWLPGGSSERIFERFAKKHMEKFQENSLNDSLKGAPGKIYGRDL